MTTDIRTGTGYRIAGGSEIHGVCDDLIHRAVLFLLVLVAQRLQNGEDFIGLVLGAIAHRFSHRYRIGFEHLKHPFGIELKGFNFLAGLVESSLVLWVLFFQIG